jgi:hypothetical protein
MSSTDTSYINQKKEKDDPKPKNIAASYLNFVIALAKIIAIILITMLFGSSILYACKAATANVLPTDVDCSPYSGNDPYVMPIDIDIDVNKVDGKFYSTKINFPFNKSDYPHVNKAAIYNRSNIILDWLKKQKEVYNSWGIKIYFINVLEGLFAKNYSIINGLLYFMNKYLYEIVTILFGPLILLFLTPFITLFSFFYSIYLWFIEFHWLFKENINNKEGSKPKWEDVTFMNAYNFGLSCFIGFIMFIVLLIVYIFGFAGTSMITSFIFGICLLSTILMKSLISDGENIGKPYGVMKTFSDLLFSKLHYIMIIISLVMILLSFSYLGGASGIFSIVACVILFLGLIGNSIYNRQIPKDSTEGLSNEEVEQATRVCEKVYSDWRKGLMQNFFGQKGGGLGDENLLNKLKKLSKELRG